jgi:enoyl-CoA hydratase/carnithine racemase
MEMLLLGELLPARQAAEYGLVNRVVAADRVLQEALALAQAIAERPPATLAIGKAAFYRQIEMELGDAYDYAAGVMVQNMMHAESEEGIGAFIEKRAPVWPKV